MLVVVAGRQSTRTCTGNVLDEPAYSMLCWWRGRVGECAPGCPADSAQREERCARQADAGYSRYGFNKALKHSPMACSEERETRLQKRLKYSPGRCGLLFVIYCAVTAITCSSLVPPPTGQVSSCPISTVQAALFHLVMRLSPEQSFSPLPRLCSALLRSTKPRSTHSRATSTPAVLLQMPCSIMAP